MLPPYAHPGWFLYPERRLWSISVVIFRQLHHGVVLIPKAAEANPAADILHVMAQFFFAAPLWSLGQMQFSSERASRSSADSSPCRHSRFRLFCQYGLNFPFRASSIASSILGSIVMSFTSNTRRQCYIHAYSVDYRLFEGKKKERQHVCCAP